MNIFKKFFYSLRFRYAVIMADKAHAKSGICYFVIPDNDGKLVVMDRKNFRLLKHKKYIRKETSYQIAIHTCLYRTPDGSGRNGLSSESMRNRFNQYIDFLSSKK